MHLRPVVVSLKLGLAHIEEAPALFATARAPLIGDERTVYDLEESKKRVEALGKT